jgi:hypothetical protein
MKHQEQCKGFYLLTLLVLLLQLGHPQKTVKVTSTFLGLRVCCDFLFFQLSNSLQAGWEVHHIHKEELMFENLTSTTTKYNILEGVQQYFHL